MSLDKVITYKTVFLLPKIIVTNYKIVLLSLRNVGLLLFFIWGVL